MEKDEIFLWGVLAFVVGIACGSLFVFSVGTVLLLGGAFFIALFVAFPKQAVFVFGIVFLFLVGGAELAAWKTAVFQSLHPMPEIVAGEVRVVSDPEERDFFQQMRIRFEFCAGSNCPETAVLWQAPISVHVEAGTRLSFACRLEQPQSFSPDFDYRMFLAKDGIGYICTHATQASVLPGDWKGQLRSWLYVPKHILENAFSQMLSEPEAGLAKGLLLGGDHYLPKALKDDFTRIGLSHMIAVSGYNITIIAELLLMGGLFLGLWRRQAIWFALVGIVFFIVMIGMPASAARAGAMASIVFVALQTGRLAQPVNALLFAGAVMLFFNPLLLRYDLGFQLSFLATLGILWGAPYYERLALKGVVGKKLSEVVLMTFAVELFVLPIILFFFHTFSVLIIIGNFLVILVPFAMATAFLAAILFLVVPGAHIFFAWVAFALLSLITRGVEWLSSFEGNIVVPNFGMLHLVSWYILLFVFVFLVARYFPQKRYVQQI